MIRCPCCGCLTIDNSDEVVTDICAVCFWQYDEAAQDMPERVIGENGVSLHTARKNYRLFGAVEKQFLEMVRPPCEEEL